MLEVIGNFGSEELLLQDDREVSSICKLPCTQSRRLAPTPCASCLPWSRGLPRRNYLKNLQNHYNPLHFLQPHGQHEALHHPLTKQAKKLDWTYIRSTVRNKKKSIWSLKIVDNCKGSLQTWLRNPLGKLLLTASLTS